MGPSSVFSQIVRLCHHRANLNANPDPNPHRSFMPLWRVLEHAHVHAHARHVHMSFVYAIIARA